MGFVNGTISSLSRLECLLGERSILKFSRVFLIAACLTVAGMVVLAQNLQGSGVGGYGGGGQAAIPDGETKDLENSLSDKRTSTRRHVTAHNSIAWNQTTIALNHINSYNEPHRYPDVQFHFNSKTDDFKSGVNPSGAGMLRNMRARRDGNLRIYQSLTTRVGVITTPKISAQNTPSATTSSRK